MSVNLVSMDFEGADASTTFTDSGTGASTWTAGGASALSTVSPAPLTGTASLKIPALNADYIKTAYGANNCLPARGDWDILMRVRCTGWDTGGVGKTFLSAQSPAAAAIDTAFALATNSTRKLLIVLSDGTTRSVIATSTSSMANNTTYDISAARRGNTVSVGFGAGTGGGGTFTGAIHLPVGRDLRLGNQEGGNTGAVNLWVDTFRIVVYPRLGNMFLAM